MIEIDGAAGEGGGQVLRTSLSLSAITGEPVRITAIRAGRRRPGLMRQHLTALLALVELTDAEVEGADPGSMEVTFRPRRLRGGDHHVRIGTAGSTTLVIQTVLPALLLADEPGRIVIEGGTHNPGAPTAIFLEQAFLPVLRAMGARVSLRVERPGFFPAGGGRVCLETEPSPDLRGVELLERGPLLREEAEALISGLPPTIAVRELATVGAAMGWAEEQCRVHQLSDRHGPGNVVSLVFEMERHASVFTGFGQSGVRAEEVAERVCHEARSWLATGAAVCPHLADQLVVPFAIAGEGRLRTSSASDHLVTNVATASHFPGMEFSLEAVEESVLVSCLGRD